MTIPQNLRDLRRLCGLTQEEAAARVHVTRQTISSYESGRTQPDLQMLMKLAALYEVDISAILYGRSVEQEKMRALRTAAVVTAGVTWGFIFAASCLLFCLNQCFPIPSGLPEDSLRSLMERRFFLLDLVSLFQAAAAGTSLIGSIILGGILSILKSLPSPSTRILSVIAFMAGAAACSLPFGLFDKVYHLIDYGWVIAQVLFPAMLLLFYTAILSRIKKARTRSGDIR